MRSYIDLISRLPLYYSFRNLGKPVLLPFNYTFSLTYRCNSKCKTCNIWKIKKAFELNTEEWISVIKSLGNSPFWITLSGGEPLLRRDLEEIVKVINEINKPKFITIPTNGLIDQTRKIERILKILDEKTKLILNFSVDGIGEQHDFIRGVKGSWERVLKMYKNSKKLKERFENLYIGVHTVISVYNVKEFEKIARFIVENLRPDSYITEIAENRKELYNLNLKITPSLPEYKKAIKFLLEIMEKEKRKSLFEVQALRREYYKYVINFLSNEKSLIASYAGFASVHITPSGEVWDCAVVGNELGKLEEFDYNFKKLWKSEEANRVREKIKKSHKCVLASEFYSNALFSFSTAKKLFFDLIFR